MKRLKGQARDETANGMKQKWREAEKCLSRRTPPGHRILSQPGTWGDGFGKRELVSQGKQRKGSRLRDFLTTTAEMGTGTGTRLRDAHNGATERRLTQLTICPAPGPGLHESGRHGEEEPHANERQVEEEVKEALIHPVEEHTEHVNQQNSHVHQQQQDDLNSKGLCCQERETRLRSVRRSIDRLLLHGCQRDTKQSKHSRF